MKLKDCGLLDEIFTHIDDPSNVVRNFNATAMVKYAQQRRQVQILVPIDSEFTKYIQVHRGIEQARLGRLQEPYLHWPVVFAEMEDGSHLLVDGHHRWVKLAQLGEGLIRGYRFALGSWTRFLVEDLHG